MGSGITRDDWLQALEESGVKIVDDRDAVTVLEFAELVGGLSHSGAMRRLRALEEAGRAVKTTKWSSRAGRRSLSTAFRLVTPKKKR